MIIDKLNPNKSAGLDFIGPRVLKLCGDAIVNSITFIINRSIDHGVFPDDLKKANVTPNLKSGDKSNLNNYRPISILPTISKIFGLHIAKQLHDFSKETNVIHNFQFGFSPPAFMLDCTNSFSL